jgi:hypothetical protein
MDTQTIRVLTEQAASDRRRIADLESLSESASTSQCMDYQTEIYFVNFVIILFI